MNISQEQIHHLAGLSNFSLSDEEVAILSADLAKILDYISQLDQLDTTDVEPTFQISPLTNVWREDNLPSTAPTPSPTALLDLAPETENHQIKVPKVL